MIIFCQIVKNLLTLTRLLDILYSKGVKTMKKLFVAILILTIINTAYSGPFGRFEIGPATNDSIYFTEISIGYRLKFFQVTSETSGSYLTWAHYNGSSGNPFQNIYSVEQKFFYNNFFIHAKHHCAHSSNSATNSHIDVNGYLLYREFRASPYWWHGKITTISAGFEFNMK